MEPKLIKWDGCHIPEELRSLPPGRYAIEPVDHPTSLTEQLEGIVESKKRLEQTAIAKRMRAARGKMLPLGMRVKDLVEEGRER